jgi:membrane protease YdiL (CAAX protease family)
VSFLFAPDGRLRARWRCLLFLAAFVLGGLALAFAAGVVMAIALLPGDCDPDSFVESRAFLAIATFVSSGYAILLALVFRHYVDRRPVSSMGMRLDGSSAVRTSATGAACGAAQIAAVVVVLIAIGQLEAGSAAPSLEPVAMVPVLLVAALMEEVVCRGYLLQNFMDARRPIAGIVLTSVFFWLMHAFNDHAWVSPWISVNLILAGVELALAYIASGNLWFPTALHFAWNYVQGAVFGMAISGNDVQGFMRVLEAEGSHPLLSGGPFGLEGSVLVTVSELVVIAALAAWAVRSGRLRLGRASQQEEADRYAGEPAKAVDGID